MNKVIFVSNHKGFVKFNAPYMEWLMHKGWQVDDAGPGMEEAYKDSYNTHYDIGIVRNPFSWGNIRAIREMRKLLRRENYDLIHCHTPMGGVVARVASLGLKTKVLYTVHGYHFFKGAPLLNWLIYLPIELLLRWNTDYLVTINKEDYAFAKKWNMTKKQVFNIKGVGFKNKFSKADNNKKSQLRVEYGFTDNDFILLYTAQFISRKNHTFIIESLPAIVRAIPNVKLVLVGNGSLLDEMKSLSSRLCLDKNVVFMGGRSDVEKFCQMADVYVSASFFEGLCISNLEAMACGLPLVLSDVRGQNDVCVECRNGYLFKIGDKRKFTDSVIALSKDDELRKQMGLANIEDVKEFSLENSLNDMAKIYSEIFKDINANSH